jgi:prepilin peptidase CpaA
MNDPLLILPLLGSLLAAGFDLVRFRIPNWLSLGLALLYVPAALLVGAGGEVLLGHLLAGGICLAVAFLLFLGRVWGGGDAKLFPALCLWLGWPKLVHFTFAMALAGGVLALVLLVLRRRSWPENISRHKQLRRLLGAKSAIPYAVAMAFGMIWAVFHG